MWVDGGGGGAPLSREFGCTPDMAIDWLRHARDLGLHPSGVSFHVGSQQTDLAQWDSAIGRAARMFSLLAKDGIALRMVNIGGGFPARYNNGVPGMARYAAALMSCLTRHFGRALPSVLSSSRR